MRKWIGLVLAGLLVLLAGGGALQAQDDGDDAFIDFYDAELVFPAVIRFFLRVSVPVEQVDTVSLEVGQGDTILHSGPVDLEAGLINAEPFAFIHLDYPLTRSDALAFFEPVAYHWEVVDAGGGSHAAEGEVLYQPPGDTWRQSGEPPLRFTVLNPELNLITTRQVLVEVYALMSDLTGLSPDFNWAILPRGYQFCVEEQDADGNPVFLVHSANGDAFPCREADAQGLFADNGLRLLYRQAPGLLPFQNEVIVDVFDEFFGRYWRGQDVPAWFRSGLTQLYYVTSNPLALRQVQDASRNDRLFSVGQLDSVPSDEDEQGVWQQQAYTMVLYLADTYGAGAPFELARDLVDTLFEDALQDLVGQDFDRFLVHWERWLFTDQAGRAVAWTLYAPPTPTLPPTRTPTPFPPTATATPTVTRTPSPTATPTATSGVAQVATPVPTYTPFTSVPPTPSNTPRPPGSLDRPTADDGSGGGGGICSAALPALLLPIAGIVLVQRRKHIQ